MSYTKRDKERKKEEKKMKKMQQMKPTYSKREIMDERMN
jgi:hypothetical protein